MSVSPIHGAPAINPYIAHLTLLFLEILTWSIIARAFMSWLPVDQGSPLVQMLHRITEPIIDPIRRLMPQTGMMDFSPMLAIFALIILSQFVQRVAQPL